MRPNLIFLGLTAAAFGVAGCGDNSNECGPGTKLNAEGFCIVDGNGSGSGAACGDGTVIDNETNTCVPDPSLCQGGTVYIEGAGCVDPTEELAIDVNEGAEPNGFNIGEASTAAAGTLTLKAPGETLVVKGTIAPFRDATGDGANEPDYDTYLFAVDGPAMLEVAVDGVNGLNGAFVAVAAADNAAAGWQRFGISAAGDTSKRQVWLPGAGTYAIAVTDARTLYQGATNPPVIGTDIAVGGDTAAYFMSIQVVPTVTQPLTLDADGIAVAEGTLETGTTKLYAVPMGSGFNFVELTMAGSTTSSVVLTRGDEFLKGGDEEAGLAALRQGGFEAAEEGIIAVDTVSHYGAPAAYTLTVTTGNATALSRTGETVSEAEKTDAPETYFDLNAFYYDVEAADEIDGISLVFDQAVDIVLYDQNITRAAFMTWVAASGGGEGPAGTTITQYKGHIRHRAPGRYYFFVYEPSGGGATDISVTSTIAPVTPTAITLDTPLADQAVDTTFESNLYTFDASSEPWQSYNAIGNGTGTLTLAFNNAATAYGRLDPLTGGTADSTPVFTYTYVEAGAPRGRIAALDPVDNFLVTVNTATPAGTFTLDLATRVYNDLGDVSAAAPVTKNDVALDAAAPKAYYLFQAAGLNQNTITVHPDIATDNTVIQLLNADESVRTSYNNGAAGADDTGAFAQSVTGLTAFAVATVGAPAAGSTHDVTVSTALTAYSAVQTDTQFVDACAGGEVVAMEDGDEGFSVANYPTPAGFTVLGAPQTEFQINSNGFITFDLTLNCSLVGLSCFFSNTDLPVATNPNNLIAPYWDDAVGEVCTKVDGTKRIVQWVGSTFGATGAPIAFQVILDTDNTIEFVYGPGHALTGQSASIGFEDAAGAAAIKYGFNTAGTVGGGTAIKATPSP